MFSYAWVCLLASTSSLLALQEEDFGFEPEVTEAPHSSSFLRRLWGIPDVKARVGQLFHFAVPVDAFEGSAISFYVISTISGKPLPSWLQFNSVTGLLEGVPDEENIGEIYVLLKAFGNTPEDVAKDLFAIEVLPRSHILSFNAKERCRIGEDITTLTIAIDRPLEDISPKDKIIILKNLAGFLGMPYEKLSVIPQAEEELFSDAVIMAGPGSVKKKTEKTASLLQWQVGCGGKVFPAYKSQIEQVKVNSRDSTIAEVIQFPVLGWSLAVIPAGPTFRHRREVVGSGDSENDLELEETENEADTEIEVEPEMRIIPSMATPVFLEPVTSATPEVHRHRHQHGESPPIEVSTSLLTSPIPFASIMPTPVYIPERPTILTSIEPVLPNTSVFEEMTIVATPTYFVEPSATPEPTTQDLDVHFIESSTEHTTTESPTTPVTPETSTKPEEVLEPENTPPIINQKLPRQALTAGKPFRYLIPDFIFSDAEDGNTTSLHLNFKTQDGNAVPPSSWVQFNSTKQEVYALPLEENVSKWIFLVEAMDKEGETVQDKLELSVQNHKGMRTVTHQFTMDYDVVDIHRFTTPLDWQLLILDRLAGLYNDANPSHITVLALTESAPFSFTWTNDSLPRNHCPQDELINLLKVIRASDDGTPTDSIKRAMAPNIIVKNITWLGKGPCESIVPEVNVPSSAENYPPTPRNQVDVLNATVGELLVYTVPEDTFYDPEDGGTRYLKLSLYNIDRTKIAPDHWLQFDSKNQEFYGIPKTTDVGRTEYQLECKDSGNKTLIDSLIVSVQPARKAYYNVEFGMSLNMDYETLTSNPIKLRRFVEKIAQIFGDKDTSSIVLSGFSPVPTTSVTWHNRSLPTVSCPHKQIAQLREMLVVDDINDKSEPSENAKRTLGNEFPVNKATVTSTGVCLEETTLVHNIPAIPEDEARPVSRSDEYLVTVVVPAVVIAGMLICAGIVACFLYRRRRTGKMSVGSEDERQSFRSKGIPVIFQDELEERPEPANKSPVIMKEEKPPLPPPEYHQRMALLSDTDHEDSPYQPPPPFASSRDSARPKPTPTYRMPPPYVPP